MLFYEDLLLRYSKDGWSWVIIDDPQAIEDMRSLEHYHYGGEWIYPGWLHDTSKPWNAKENQVWYPRDTVFHKGVEGVLFLISPTQEVTVWTTNERIPAMSLFDPKRSYSCRNGY